MKTSTIVILEDKDGEVVFTYGTSFMNVEEMVLGQRKKGREVRVEGERVFVRFGTKGEEN